MKKTNVRTLLNQNGLLPVCEGREMLGNLGRNWYLLLSALGYYGLVLDNSEGYFLQFPVFLLGILFFATQFPGIKAIFREAPRGIRVLSGLSALGFCQGNVPHFRLEMLEMAEEGFFSAETGEILAAAGAAAAVLALPFVYTFVLMIGTELKKLLGESGLFRGLTRGEKWVCGLLTVVFLGLMAGVFLTTEGFYGTEHYFDVIYTSDSPDLVKTNVYMTLTHTENDLRQPLFAVFAAPFLGLPSLIGRMLPRFPAVNAIALNSVQVAMLMTANLMLAKMLGLSSGKRICFVLLICCCYPMALFTLMMEQYIVAYFWMVLCMYRICEGRYGSRMPLWAAGGTLLTSLALLPFCSEKHPVKQFWGWLGDMVRFCVEFGLVLLVLCRLDVVFNVIAQVDFLTTFTGEALTAWDKVLQYLSFVSGCFAAPEAAVTVLDSGFAAWWLTPVTELNVAGIVILAVSAVSAGINCRKRSSQIAAVWIAMSAVLLIGLGWGTIENGLILYGLYFGWAFLVLPFQLVDRIGEKLGLGWLLPVCAAVAVTVLLAVNIPAIRDMIAFAVEYYPV